MWFEDLWLFIYGFKSYRGGKDIMLFKSEVNFCVFDYCFFFNILGEDCKLFS